MSPSPTYVFVKLTDRRGLAVILRLDQIVSVVGKPKAANIERDIDVLTQRIAQYEDDGRPDDPFLRRNDHEHDLEQLATLERERDADHAGSRLRLLDGVSHDVAEAPDEVLDLMQRAFVGAQL